MNEEILMNIWKDLSSNNLTDSEFDSWKTNISENKEVQNNVHNYLVDKKLTDSDFDTWKANVLGDGSLAKMDAVAVEDAATPADTGSASEGGSLESQEEDTLVERVFGKNEVTDSLGDIWRAGVQGVAQSEAVDPSMDLMTSGADSSLDQIYKYIRVNEELSKNQKIQDEMASWDKDVDKNGGGAYGILMATINNPGIAIPVMVSSMATMVGSLQSEQAVAATAVGVGLGGTAGLSGAVLAPATVPIGMAVGGFAALSGTMEAALTFNELLQEEIGGVLTPEKVKMVLSDPEKLSTLRQKAIARGAVISAVDFISGGVAGKLTGTVLKKAVPLGTSIASRAAIKTAGVAGGVLVEGAGGGIGEASARAVIGQEMDAKDIALEVIGEFGGAGISVVPAAYSNLKTVSGRVKANKTATEGGYKNASSVFDPNTDIDETTITLASNKNTSNLVDEQVEIEVANGRMTQDEANAIKENFRSTQGAVNTANKIDRLTSENKTEAVKLLIEEAKLKDKIKDVDNASLTKTESVRLKEVQANLENIGNPSEVIVDEEVIIKPEKYTTPTEERFGYINRADNKGVINLSESEFNEEIAKFEESKRDTETEVKDETIEQPATDVPGVRQDNKQEVEDLRAKEQVELLETIPNAENYLTDGKVDKEKITNPEDIAKFEEVYNRYDKLISPLLETTTTEESTVVEVQAESAKSKLDAKNKIIELQEDIEFAEIDIKDKAKSIESSIAEVNKDKTLSSKAKKEKVSSLNLELENFKKEKSDVISSKQGEISSIETSISKTKKKPKKPLTPIQQAGIDKLKGRIINQADNARKALAKIANGVTIEVYETQEEFEATIGGDSISAGIYHIPTKTIKINLEIANLKTVAHEVFHALLLKDGMNNATAQKVTSNMLKSIKKVASPKLLKELDAFSNRYDNKLQSEESIAQLFGILAENYESSPQSVKDIINSWLNKLAKALNVPVENIVGSDKDVLDFLNIVSAKVASGEVIEQTDIEILKNEEQGESGEVGTLIIPRQQIDVIDSKNAKNDPRKWVRDLVDNIDLINIEGVNFVTNMYDYTSAGVTELGNGYSIDLLGGRNYVPLMMTKKGKKLGDVSNLAAFNTKSQAEGFIKNAIDGKANMFAPHAGTLKDSWQFQQHIFESLVNLVLDNNILTNKEIIKLFDSNLRNESAKKTYAARIKSIKEKGFYIKKVEGKEVRVTKKPNKPTQFLSAFKKFRDKSGLNISSLDSFESDPKELVRLLDIENNFSPDLRKSFNGKIASNKKFQKAIGVKNLQEFYQRIMDPLNEGVVGGELMTFIQFDPSTFEVSKTNTKDIDHHPSFGWGSEC